MEMTYRPTTLGELVEAGYRHRSVRDEMRENLLAMLERKENPFPGILGYERTVVPALVNAILARHDLILLGLRGQAKTRILRALVNLLDEATPVIVGSELNESPFAPFTKYARNLAAASGPDLPVAWLSREERYREKLATPDVTIADLIGDVDPVKAATLKKTFADEDVIHYGIVPRTNRGIFAINELPDLAPRIQVGLLNILEERDLQIRGFPVRIPLDVVMVFSANPEDYTNRGNIITPLKDRIASQILTHYPRDIATAKAITDQEAWSSRPLDGVDVRLPDSFAHPRSRRSPSSRGGATSSTRPRASRPGCRSRCASSSCRTWSGAPSSSARTVVAPRLVDLFATLPAITGKVEMVFEGEQQGAEIVARKLIGDAVKALFEATFPPVDGPRARGERARRREVEEEDAGPFGRERGPAPLAGPYERVVAHFTKERKIVLSDETPFARHLADLDSIDGLAELVAAHASPADDFERAFLMELVARRARPEPSPRARGPRLDGHLRGDGPAQPDEEPRVGAPPRSHRILTPG